MKFQMLIIFLVLCTAQNTMNKQCSCNQIQIERDCSQNNDCSWNKQTNKCESQTKKILAFSKYCEGFIESECPKKNGCAWNNGECSHFTGCTAYNKQKPEDCQGISNICTSDGAHCIDIDVCTTYTNEISCTSIIQQQNCYWDIQKSICLDVTQCEQLSNITDADCRQRITFCTSSGAGCIQSGINCSDQKSEAQCFWNISMTQKCFWNDQKCCDKTCANGPLQYKTESECQTIDEQCTTKKGGGCVIKSTCEKADVMEACTTDQQKQNCFWNGTNCVTKICANAPLEYKTNQECQSFLPMCITNGSGCIINTICSSALIQIACQKNAQGEDCYWDQSCKEKTCINANSSFNTHELCSSFLSQCTTNGQGCQNRTCENGPINLKTNKECEDYLPNNNCITKQGGGCRTNTICSQINIEIACEQDQGGKQCFWDQEQQICKEKTCQNAPAKYKTHKECRKYLSICTNKQDENGCINNICENIQDSNLCTFNMYKQPCIYKNNKCRAKECALASQQLKTHSDCFNYLDSCTLSNTGAGCVQIPLKCEAITIKQACVLKKVQQIGTIKTSFCGWNGTSCIDRNCSTAPIEYTTTQQCSQYLNNCVSANPITLNGIKYIQGCINLPEVCSDRKSVDNCQVYDAKCVWIEPTQICVRKTCQTANQIGTSITLINFNNQNCNQYLQNCILNNTGDGCMDIPQNCSFLGQSNCSLEQKVNQGCYWSINGYCRDLTCNNIENAYNHQICNSILNTCTINQDLNGCQNLQNNCGDYAICDQCYKTLKGQNCIWLENKCQETFCSNHQCSIYQLSPYPNLINQQICMNLQSDCSMYIEQSQCGRTIQSQINDCAWIYGRCCSFEMIKNGQCCPADIQTDNQIINCEQKTVSDHSLTWTQCQEYDISCSVNSDKSACITKFTTETSCITSDSSQICAVWRTVPLNLCEQIIYPSDCEFYTSLPGDLIHSDCQICNILCTATVDGSGCQEYVDKCVQYTQFDQCSQSKEGKCQWFNDSCIKVPNNRILIEQNIFIGNNSNILYNIQASCTFYSYSSSCQYNSYGEKCFWNPTSGNCIELTCENIEQTQLYNTHQKCTEIDSYLLCTVNNQLNGCKRRTSCHQYIVKEQCHLNDLGQSCIWNQNLQIPACQDKSCSTAPQYEYYTHQDCQKYLSEQAICTVGVRKEGTILIFLGCQNLSDCSSYIAEEQCKINQQGNLCAWKNNKCADQSCLTAPDNFITDIQCKQYLPFCTISQSGNGCIETPISCEIITNQQQCIIDKYGKQCIWLNNSCITKTCQLVNDNELECNSFSSECIYTVNNCQTKICEDYPYKTDSLCKAAMPSCTTDGLRCVLRGTCLQVQSKAGCVLSINNEECEWLDQQGYCINKSCDTAPIALDNETLCSQYFPNCTTKLGGGCIKKSTCDNVNIQKACTSDLYGAKCYWDNNICIYQSNFNNRPCQQFNQEQCIFSNTEGPCLWVIDEIAQISSCQAYQSCSSISWITDLKCKQLSNNCTTNGKNCIAITSCDQTNINGGCVTGYDGQCYYNNSKCQKFTQCSDIYYSTHQDCQIANQSCTTNGKDTCQTLKECYLYEEFNCYISSKGKITTINGIQETGICVWDKNNKKCRQQECNDLIGITHGICNQQLINCTSNGSNCISMELCADYSSQIECQTAKGKDGFCMWEEKCSLIIDCQSADKQTCFKANDRCQWIQGINNTQSQCKALTCQSYYESHQKCTNFYNWDYTILNFCKLQSGQCNSTDPQEFNNTDCYSDSNHTYYWDTTISKCRSCNTTTTVSVNNPIPEVKSVYSLNQFKGQIFFFIIIGNLIF